MARSQIDEGGSACKVGALDPFDIERLQGLLEQTTDQFERRRLRGLLQFASPEARKAHGAITRARMATSAVRQRIRDGMERAGAPELIVLRQAWRNAPPDVRVRFLAEIAGEAIGAGKRAADG